MKSSTSIIITSVQVLRRDTVLEEQMCWVQDFKPAGRSMDMANKRIFISYDYSNDGKYKELVLSWDKDENLDFSFYDMSVSYNFV